MKYGFLRNLKTLGMWAVMIPAVLGMYVVVWLDRMLKLSHGFPRNVDDLREQKDWCLNTLKENGVLPKDALVNEYKVTVLKPLQIFRSNAGVVEINYTSNGDNKTLRCFAKFAPGMGSIGNRVTFNIQMNHVKEANFNQYFVAGVDGFPAPEVYCAKVSPLTGNLCLITEFMEDCVEYLDGYYHLLPVAQLDNAVDGLADMHSRFWNEKSERMKKIIPITEGTVYLFDSMVAGRWSIAARKILVQSWNYMNEFQTVLHGDARLGNMMFPSAPGKGRFVLFDWQAVRTGRAAFDLAYFLILSLIPEWRKADEQKCIDRYYEGLVNRGVKDYSRQQLEDDYRHGCLCVLVLLALPMLSGEASVEGESAVLFVTGMSVWRERMQDKFKDFDYAWVEKNYGITGEEARLAIEEMLSVIEKRLQAIRDTVKTDEPLETILKRHKYME